MLFSLPEARVAFPNLRVVGREKAHASRRVLSRPQSADLYLTEVCNRFIWNYDSVASTIEHNSTVTDLWCGAPRSDPASSQIEKLRFRRHRFDSQAEPMTRIVLAFDAVLQTLAAVSHARKTEDIGKHGNIPAVGNRRSMSPTSHDGRCKRPSHAACAIKRPRSSRPSLHGIIRAKFSIGRCPALAGGALLGVRLHSQHASVSQASSHVFNRRWAEGHL